MVRSELDDNSLEGRPVGMIFVSAIAHGAAQQNLATGPRS
jgi:hypothetical protein